jgi:transcriptional regulator with XRE-family HTH domain
MADTGSGGFRALRHDAVHPGVLWREEMDRRDVTQAEMSRRTGKSAKHINQILQGNALPSAETVVKMARVLHDDDESEAQHVARVMFGLQGRHLLQQALTKFRDWRPRPDFDPGHEREDKP